MSTSLLCQVSKREVRIAGTIRPPKRLLSPPVGRVISTSCAREHDATLAFPKSKHLLPQGEAAGTWTKHWACSIGIGPHFIAHYLV